jgi:DNA (cytosine-5)-methyltransferase 1
MTPVSLNPSAQGDSSGEPKQLDLFATPALDTLELFHRQMDTVRRGVRTRQGNLVWSSVPDLDPKQTPELAFEASWLRGGLPVREADRGRLQLVDLFSGCGALTLGIVEAGRALGLQIDPVLAVDLMPDALATYGLNFPNAILHAGPVESVLGGSLGSAARAEEADLGRRLGQVDILVGGPPCQGHSDLNNHTRRNDPKNELYLRMARFAELFEPQHIVIENVPGVVHDINGVAQRTRSYLMKLGYRVQGTTIHAVDLGVAQRRKRYLTVASKSPAFNLETAVARLTVPERSVGWAIGDLLNVANGDVFDTPAKHAEQNERRIAYLFEHDLHELPDSERPVCHRDKPHTYKSVYGRLHWDEPSGTITSGFGSTGQGRFVHPLRPRSLTPHEAARLQYLPDFFQFPAVGRRSLQEMIGNAVPPKLAYAVGLELFR